MSYWNDAALERAREGHFYGEDGFCIYCHTSHLGEWAFLGCGHKAWVSAGTRHLLLRACPPRSYSRLPAMRFDGVIRAVTFLIQELEEENAAVAVLPTGSDDG